MYFFQKGSEAASAPAEKDLSEAAAVEVALLEPYSKASSSSIAAAEAAVFEVVFEDVDFLLLFFSR
jgi:hypothetical protein